MTATAVRPFYKGLRDSFRSRVQRTNDRGRWSIAIVVLAGLYSGATEYAAAELLGLLEGFLVNGSSTRVYAQEPPPQGGPQRAPGNPGNVPGGVPGGPGGFPGGIPGGFPGGGPGGFPGGQEMKVRERFDANQDGYLDRAERQEARAQLAKERPAGGGRGGMGRGPGGGFPGGGFPGGGFPGPGVFPGPGGGGPGGGGPGAFPAGPPTQMLSGHLLRQADKDQDGKLSATELTTFWEQLFRAHDQDRDGKLDEAEMAPLLEKILPAPGWGAGGGPPGGFPRRETREPAKPGVKLSPSEVAQFQDEAWFDHQVLRTLFFTFEEDDWEAELAEFHNTDVDVPAKLQVDGREYPLVGMSFRGMSSYGMVPAGYKRSFNVVVDLVDGEQRVHGLRTLNLLNAHEDPSCLSSVLYSQVARHYLPAPRANFVRVVVNGENWGIYVNVEQFNKDFLKENFHTTKGDRWKVRGSPAGGGGLEYLGENVDDYQRRYQLKSADKPEAWQALMTLCRTLNQTPAEELERALEPLLDLDGVLRFLALDVALINNDGYWVRASDYSIYRDSKGKFHLLPHDMNEAFHGQMGGPGMGPPGMRGGRGPGDASAVGQPARPSPVALDPLVALDDPRKPLRSRLLAVPALRERYLRYVRQIAQEQLDWKQLGPTVTHFRRLLEPELARDTRKLSSLEAFLRATADEPTEGSLRGFIEQRRAYLLSHPALGALHDPAPESRRPESREPGKPGP